jgi:hypothetical protein
VGERCTAHLQEFEHLPSAIVDGDVLALFLDNEAIAVVSASFETVPDCGMTKRIRRGVALTRVRGQYHWPSSLITALRTPLA